MKRVSAPPITVVILAGRRTGADAWAKSSFNHAAPQTIPYAIERYQVEISVCTMY